MNNLVILTGYVGKKDHIEYREFSTGKSLLKFSMATSDRMRKSTGDYTMERDWHAIECWNNVASSLSRMIEEGDMVMVHGSIKYNKFESGGSTKKVAVVRAKLVNILSKKSSEFTEEDYAAM